MKNDFNRRQRNSLIQMWLLAIFIWIYLIARVAVVFGIIYIIIHFLAKIW